jgi:hypothetical protein
MISKSKLGAIAVIAATGLTAIGLGSPAFAQNPPNYGPQFYAPSQSGGGSIGYNQKLETYRLKQHPRTHHPAAPSQ